MTATVDSNLVTSLRQEIVSSQNSQADLLKWKLIATASVAVVGLGIGTWSQNSERGRLVICLIPLLCAYVDLLSMHLRVRILVIGEFLRDRGDPYEQFVHDVRQPLINPFAFETMALHGSSIGISCVIALIGALGTFADATTSDAYILCGAVGAFLTASLYVAVRSRTYKLTHHTSTSTAEAH